MTIESILIKFKHNYATVTSATIQDIQLRTTAVKEVLVAINDKSVKPLQNKGFDSSKIFSLILDIIY